MSPAKGVHPLLQWVAGDGGASGLKGVIINELEFCHRSNRKNREEKREEPKKFLDLVFLPGERR